MGFSYRRALLLLPLCVALCAALTPREEANLFRDIFATYAQRENIVLHDLKDIIYLPNEEMFEKLNTKSLEDFDLLFKQYKATDLAAEGAKYNISVIKDVNAPLIMRQKPITILVFPGIFGEFIESYPFYEFFQENTRSSFATTFYKAYGTAKKEDRTDKMFNLYAMEDLDRSMLDLMKVASMDDENGNPLLQLAFFKPDMGSLETFGTLEANRDLYFRRMRKFYNIMEPYLGSLYLLGYSRSVPVVLDIISNVSVSDNKPAWYSKVEGVISLDGVIFGSPMADCALDPDIEPKSQCKAVRGAVDAIRELKDNLIESDAVLDISKNVFEWGKAVAAVGEAFLAGSVDPRLKKIDLMFPDIQENWQTIIKKIFFDQFDLSKPIGDYVGNVKRFRYMAQKMLDGAQLLCSKDRIEWYKANTLPTHLHYVAITSTQQDADLAVPETPNSFFAMGNAKPKVHPDYFFLRSSYYIILEQSEHELQDGQVPTSHEIFLPGVHQALNSKQEPYEAHLACVLASTHWGSAFSVAIETTDHWVNPFPRAVLVKAIGNFVARF
eukprot:Colp12_sorted_trinity150504_noHs@36502